MANSRQWALDYRTMTAARNDPDRETLITLHGGMPRQGPGDEALVRRILWSLPPLPAGDFRLAGLKLS